jgi:endonuclease YncB( thermonuclease family)
MARSATDSVEATAYELIVVDGDTLRFGGESVRLMGYDTPEVTLPQCAREAEMGDLATELLQTLLIQASTIRLDFEPHRDRYDRRLATLYINDHNIAELMIEAGLAKEYNGGQRRSWCN